MTTSRARPRTPACQQPKPLPLQSKEKPRAHFAVTIEALKMKVPQGLDLVAAIIVCGAGAIIWGGWLVVLVSAVWQAIR
jgi:hypothetical protein